MNVCTHKQKTHAHKTVNLYSTKQGHSVTQVLYPKSRYDNISAVGALYITGNFFLGMSSVSSVIGHVLMSTTMLASCKCPDILLRSANNVFCTIMKWWQKKKKDSFTFSDCNKVAHKINTKSKEHRNANHNMRRVRQFKESGMKCETTV